MRPQPKEREPFNAKRLMVLAFSVVFGLLLGWAVGRVSSATPLGPLIFLLSFLAAIFVHELGHAFAAGRFFGGPLQSSWMNPFSVVSGALAILSLIPMRSFYRSDGAQIWDLLRSPATAERHCALLAIAGAAKAGLRPREWDTELI